MTGERIRVAFVAGDVARAAGADVAVVMVATRGSWHQLFCADPVGRVVDFHQVVRPPEAPGAGAPG